MKTRFKKIFFIATFFLLTGLSCFLYLHFFRTKHEPVNIPFLKAHSAWVDSLMKVITLDEKIGLLFLYDAGRIDEKQLPELRSMIIRKQFGGILFSTDSVRQFTACLNQFQKSAKLPLFICMNSNDCFPSFFKDAGPLADGFPYEVISDDSLLKEYAGTTIQLNKCLGVNFIFAPDFSERHILSKDSLWLKYKAGKYSPLIKQCVQSGVIACMTGFSQTGDSVIQKGINTVYKKVIGDGITGFSFNHDIRVADKKNDVSIFSFIRNRMNFDGLVVKKIYNDVKNAGDEIINAIPGEADIILTDYEIGTIKGTITKLVIDKKIDIKIIDRKVRRILLAKAWTGPVKRAPVVPGSVVSILNSIRYKSLQQRMKAASLVLVKNDFNTIPVKNIEQEFQVYTFSDFAFQPFLHQFALYADYKQMVVDNPEEFSIEINNLKGKAIVLYDSAFQDEFIKCFRRVTDKSKLIIVHFGPDSLLEQTGTFPTLLHCYNHAEGMQSMAAQVIFGGMQPKGRLPETIAAGLKYNTGIVNTPVIRLGYTIPEETGIDGEMLTEIDDIALEAIASHATPGCQVFVAKDGKVIYNKSFGTRTYDRDEPVKWNDLYDIASVTKVAATTLAAMKMYESKKLSLDAKIGKYFKDTSINYTRIKPDTLIKIDTLEVSEIRKNKKLVEDKDTVYIDDSTVVVFDTIISKVTPKLNIFQTDLQGLMIHKSGLPPSMPVLRYVQYRNDKIFQNTSPLKSKKDSVQYLFNKFYSRKNIKDSAELQIADGFYLRKPYVDTLWNDMKQIRVYTKTVYMYSDVNMNLVQKVIDTVNEYGIDEYLGENFYKPLGVRHTCYKPRDKFDRDCIIPTSEDKFWRGQLLQGHVHDPAAAMLGGVAGNAGLFSCSNDLGVIFQMLLNKGEYGGRRYLDSATIKKFTSRQPDSYRGLGFDLASKKGINAVDAPDETFGHTGFTGTCAWADPKNKLIYIFLSNRVCPSEKNWKLNSLEVRQKIHQVIYDAMKNSKGSP